MSEKEKFITVGENIHCTLTYKVGGALVKVLDDGSNAIVYRENGKEQHLQIPSRFIETEEWQNGRVKHVIVGMWQAIYGDDAGKQAGKVYIQYMARRQEICGGTFLDINIDEFSMDIEERKKVMQWAAEVVQEATTLPLSIDSSNIDIMRAGLAVCDKSRGKPMVNSVSLERIEAIGAAKESGAVVIAGASGKESIPGTKEERVKNSITLIEKLTEAGFNLSEIHLDPLVFPVSVDPNNGIIFLGAAEELRQKFGKEIHFAPGLSNVSYGMPNRKLLNQVFTYLCRESGCDGAIVNPVHINKDILNDLDTESESFKLAKAVLTGEDQFGMNYITASREGKL